MEKMKIVEFGKNGKLKDGTMDKFRILETMEN